MVKPFLFSFVIMVLAVGCKEKMVQSINKRGGEPSVFMIKDDNTKMNLAIEEAKRTINEFDTAFDSGNPDFQFFAIKQAFPYSDGNEHIWVGNLIKKEGQYCGVIDNEPLYEIGFKLGDTVEIKNEWISDWIYYENMAVRGGYTIRAIRNTFSEDEKKVFDYQNGLFFDD